MGSEIIIDKDQLLQRIARYLMLHGSFCDNIGLLNGKTGISIFFYHYARYTGKRIYADFAGELIDEIYKEINADTPFNFKDGLCGIAWGIVYLIKNGFVKANPDEVLEELDKKILEWDVRHIRDYSLETGLTGIAYYVISRIDNRGKESVFISQDYIYDLFEALKGKASVKTNNPIFEIIDKIKYDTKKIFESSRSLGIDKAGYTGIGLQLMEINK